MNYEEIAKLNFRAERFITTELNSAKNKNLRNLLFDISEIITSNIDERQVQSPQIRQLISLGTTALTANEDHAKVAKCCLIFFQHEVSENNFEVLGHVVNCCVDQFYKQTDAKILRLLPEHFTKELEKFLANLTPVNIADDLSIGKKVWATLQKLMHNPGLSIALKHSLSGLMTVAKSKNSDAKIARRALAYLILEDDLLNDSLGIFGLADDIFVIEETASKLGLLKFGQSFLQDLKSNNSVGENFFFEQDGQLLPMGQQTKTILKSIHFVKCSSVKKIVVALPQIGPMALLHIINCFLSNVEIAEENGKAPEVGDEIYFKVLDGYVRAIFDGYREVDGNKIPMLEFSDDNFSSSVSVSEELLLGAFKKVPPNAKIFRNQKSFVNKQKEEASHLPMHVELNTFNDDKSYLIFTQKKHFVEFFYELKPFGVDCDKLFSATYIKANGSSESFGSGPINIIFCSDEVVAKDIIDKKVADNESFELIIENGNNSRSLISLLSDWHIDKIRSVISFLSTSDNEVIDELGKRNFKLICLDYAFADLDKKKSGSLSLIRRYEHFLTETAKGPSFNSTNLFLPTVDEFHYLLKEFFAETKSLDYHLRYLATDFRDRFIWSSLPLSEKQLVKIQDDKQKIIDELRFQQSPASKKFTDFFHQKWADLLDEMQSRTLLETIENAEAVDLGVFARTSVEKNKIQNYLKTVGIYTVKVVTAGFNATEVDLDTLIVPVPPSKYTRQVLANTKISKKVLLNFTEYETESFKKSRDYLEIRKQKLFHKSAPIFKKFLSVDRKINALKQKKVSIEPDDLNDLNDIDFNHIRNAQKNSSDFLQTEAFPILISDRNEYILIPANASLLKYNHSLQVFELVRPTQVDEGSIILLQKDASKDFIEELAESLISDHREKWNKSQAWRHEIRNFKDKKALSISELKKRFEIEVGVNKTVTTIRNWVTNENMVAPDDYQSILPKINQLLSMNEFGFNVTDCINSIKRVYHDRRVARENLSEFFTSNHFKDLSNQDELNFDIFGTKVTFDLKEVAGRSHLISVPYSQVWKVNTLRANHETIAS